VLITIGDMKIMSDRLDKTLGRSRDKLTPEQYAARKKGLYRMWITDVLIGEYLKKVVVSGSSMEAENRRLDDWLRQTGQTRVDFMKSRRLDEEKLHLILKKEATLREAASGEAVQKFIKEHPPSFFDGTTVRAAYMLVRTDPYDPPEVHEEAHQRAVTISQEIRTGKITFEDALKKYSSWVTVQSAGMPATFQPPRKTYPFAMAADTIRVGQTSDPVAGLYGWYVIKVYERTDGNGKAGRDAVKIAKYSLRKIAHEQMITDSLKENPVTIHE
jgi:hypothetical protein